MERMEKALSVWIEDNAQKTMPLSGPLIHAKTMRMYMHLAGVGGTSTNDAGMSGSGTSGPSQFQVSRGLVLTASRSVTASQCQTDW